MSCTPPQPPSLLVHQLPRTSDIYKDALTLRLIESLMHFIHIVLVDVGEVVVAPKDFIAAVTAMFGSLLQIYWNNFKSFGEHYSFSNQNKQSCIRLKFPF